MLDIPEALILFLTTVVLWIGVKDWFSRRR